MIEEDIEMEKEKGIVIEKEIEIETETITGNQEIIEENVMYAINMAIMQEIALILFQGGSMLIKKNPMDFIVDIKEAKVEVVEADPGQEIITIHLIKENLGEKKKIKIIEVDLLVEVGIIIDMTMAKREKILMLGEKKTPSVVKVEAGVEIGVEVEVKEKTDIEINIEIMTIEIEATAEKNIMIKKKKVMVVMQV